MTVIAWDGKIIAADKQGTYGNLIRVAKKLFRVKDEIVCLAGTAGTGMRVLEWYKSGADPSEWPEDLQTSDDWCQVIVANKHGAFWYDQQPYRMKVREPFTAWGIGADFAIGAMAMGATAIQAVKIASKYCEGCGCGVSWSRVK